MPDGDFMGFSGFTDIDVRGTYWYHRQMADAEDMGVNAMPFPRRYGGAVLLPDGRSYVTGGGNFSVAHRALGEFAVIICFRNVHSGRQQSSGGAAQYWRHIVCSYSAFNVFGTIASS